MQHQRHTALLTLVVSVACWQAPATAADTTWVNKSDAYARIVLEAFARFEPEQAAAIGVDGIDERITDLGPGRYERELADSRQVLADLEERLESETDKRVRQDLGILIKVVNDGMRSAKLNRENMLPYFNLSQKVFRGVRALIDAQVPRERYPAAIVRIKRYAGLEDGYRPLAELAKARSSERFDVEGLIGPYRGQVEQDLER
ncbi:MAG: DUF885 domain-containing protein, partial [Woeseia sp.]